MHAICNVTELRMLVALVENLDICPRDPAGEIVAKLAIGATSGATGR
jgi:hypothetical protein